MPGLVKIGRTSGADPTSRATQLYTTGVPVPFTVEFAGQVSDAIKVEQALHNAFREQRINQKREFFQVEPDQPIELLKAFSVIDVTSALSSEIDESTTDAERESRESLRAKRPALNFQEMGVPIGSTLVFASDPAISAVVEDERMVRVDGKVVSLTAATRDLKGLAYNIQPSPHWLYEGRLLRDIYNETYPHTST